MAETKIKNFTDLQTWKEAHRLAVLTYKVTKEFPKEERFSLIDQMRRCAISISSNVAEGFSRQGPKEKIQFYFMAKGSLTELQNQLLLAKDVGYLLQKDLNEISIQTVRVHKLLNGLIKSLNTRYKIPNTI
ncbi:MAG: four helix bundle protein [Patescibacteria group bacterium]